jgi:putative phage-type endonuclease
MPHPRLEDTVTDLTHTHPHRVTDHAEEVIPPHGYRTPAWHEARSTGVSASDIAVILGISPYESAFDHWWRRHLDQPADRVAEEGDDAVRRTSRGRRLEPMVIEDFEIAHPEFTVRPCGLIRNVTRTWQMATPDALVYDHVARPFGAVPDDATPVATLEAKTAGGSEGFGPTGTDEIPAHYRAQVLWQMDTLGLDGGYLAAWIGFDYREYTITYDPADVEFMRQAATRFLDSLDAGVPPLVDSHPTTRRRLQSLHPTVVDGRAEVPAAVVRQYHAARRLRDAAQDRMTLAENRLRSVMGDLRVATVDGRKVASRSVYDVPERTQVVKAHTVNRLTIRKDRA